MSAEQVALVRGDGIGPEIVAAATDVLDAVGVDVEWHEVPAGNDAYEQHGHPAPATTVKTIRDLGSALKGPFYTPSGGKVRSANHYLRPALDLFAAVRPVRRPTRGIDLVIVRENVEDLYPAIEWWAAPGVAQAIKVATEAGCVRISHVAFSIARDDGRSSVTVVHKANNLKLTEGLFLETARRVGDEYATVSVRDMMADTACSSIILDPSGFEVVLANNTFGDLLSNVAAAVAGSLGLVASANHGPDVMVAEASHGSVDELAGTGRANPVAMIRAGAMLARHLGRSDEANAIEVATEQTVEDGLCTGDLGGDATTNEVAVEIGRRAARSLSAP